MERAMRLLYLQANRRRYEDPEGLVRATAAADAAGIDVSGSQSAESVSFSRQRAGQQAQQAEAISSMPLRSAQDQMRDDMMQAARMGLSLTDFRRRFRRRGLELGANPQQLDRSIEDYASLLKPKTQQLPEFSDLPSGYSGPPTPSRLLR